MEARLGEKAALALRVLPLLFYSNAEGLPGYSRGLNSPTGINGYRPSKNEQALAKELFPNSKIKITGNFHAAIDFIAATNGIDFDPAGITVWIAAADAQMNESFFQQLQKKTHAVEFWIKKFSRFDFVLRPISCCGIRSNGVLKNNLLLGGVWLAGRTPFWRLTPPFASETQYAEQVKILSSNPSFGIQTYMDLGPAFQPPLREEANETIKTLIEERETGFSWALRLAQLEMRLTQGEQAPSTCEGAKGQILAGILVDPDIMPVDAVARFYLSENLREKARIICSWHYLNSEIRLKLGALASGAAEPGTEALARYAASWEWNDDTLKRLNAWRESGIDSALNFDKDIDLFISDAWRRIRLLLGRAEIAAWVEEEALIRMDKKIQAACFQSPQKIKKSHHRLIPHAKALTLLHRALDSEFPWALMHGIISIRSGEEEIQPLKEASDPAALILWAAANNLFGQDTKLFARGVEEGVNFSDLERLSHPLWKLMAQPHPDAGGWAGLGQDSTPVKILAAPNFGRSERELLSLTAVYETTWGEIYYRTWSDTEVLQNFCTKILIPFLPRNFHDEDIEVFVQKQKVRSMGNAEGAFQRELPELSRFLGGSSLSPLNRRRYIGAKEEGFFLIERTGQAMDFIPVASYDELLRILRALTPHSKVETLVGNYDGPLNLLREAFNNSTYGYLDIFALTDGDQGALIIIDEIGHLSYLPHYSEEQIYELSHVLVFLENIYHQVRSQPNTPLRGNTLRDCIKIHALINSQRTKAVLSTNNYLSKVDALGLKPFELGLEKDEENGYRVRWGNEVITRAQTPDPLGELQRRIGIIRQSGKDYDIFLTKVFLDDGFLLRFKGEFVSTGHYLFYKTALEAKLFH